MATTTAEAVCVTGAGGYVASELTYQLLQRGLHVKGTVRSLASREKIQHLLDMQQEFPGKLTLLEADLLQPGSFAEAVRDVDYVFHAASPFLASTDDPQRELIEPALNGTTNVLHAVAEHGNQVKRVVLTSSIAAIRGPGSVPKNGQYFTDEDWNTVSTIEGGDFHPYLLSKRLAEEAAWAIAKEKGLDLVVVNPAFVLGPPRSHRIEGVSVAAMIDWLKTGEINLARNIVDVRDVATAHIQAAFTPSAHGRYIASTEHVLTPGLIARHLKAAIPRLHLTTQPDPEDTVYPKVMDNSRLAELGVTLRDEFETIRDMAQALIDAGMVTPLLDGA